MTTFDLGFLLLSGLGLLALCLGQTAAADDSLPHLQSNGSDVQLIVDGKPYVMLSGELHNSSASGCEYMQRMWPHLKALELNTVIAPVSWELVEPQEDEFDFLHVDEMIRLARQYDQRLVLLWFGSWKNGVSSYAPGWVLRDTQRFPRAKGSSNQNTKDILSTLSDNNLQADAKAFARLMRHLKEIDGQEHTVILVQVQNEVGIKPETRDLSDEATAVYNSPVAQPLLDYLVAHKEELHPELLARWEKGGFATQGTWPEVFGGGAEADEVFSTWHYARYIDQMAEAGQQQYPLPMYVNAWLESKLGTYPTGGPVAHMHDVWRAAAPHIAFFAPDIYVGEFKEICAAYTRAGNPLFIPEASKDNEAAARCYWVIAQHHGLGFAPFGIEDLTTDHPLVSTYQVLRQLQPAITAAHGTDRMIGVYRQNGEDNPDPIASGWMGWKQGPALLARSPFYDWGGWWPAKTHSWTSTMIEYDGRNGAPFAFEYGYSQGYQVNIHLRPGERLTRNWFHNGLHVNGVAKDGGEPGCLNTSIGEGFMKYLTQYGDLQPYVLRRYDYRLRLVISGAGTGIDQLRITHDVQCPQRALPTLDKGDNAITFSAGPHDATVTIQGSSTGHGDEKQVQPFDFHPEYDGVKPQYLRDERYGKPATVTFPIATPNDMTRLRFGMHYRCRDLRDQWEMQVSFDNGKTFKTIETVTGPTQGSCCYVIVDEIPSDTDSALVRFVGDQRNTTAILSMRIDADYRLPAGGFRPVKIIYRWQEDGQPREHLHIAHSPNESEWPGWLGPNRDGKSLDRQLLKQWPDEGPKLLWQADDIGTGFSSVAVVGGKVYITGDRDDKLTISALDLDGQLLWRTDHGRGRGGPNGSRATPVIDDGKLYLLSGHGLIGCYDAANGDKKWSREAKEFGGKPGGWGYAESVLIHQDMAIFKPGGERCIVALDKTTGETIWESSGFDAGPEYGSCIIVSYQGQTMIVTGTRNGIFAVDADHGNMLWSNDWSAGNTANCPTPAYSDGHVFWSNGYGKGGVCLKLKKENDSVTVDVAWTTRDLVCHHGGYVIHQGYIYGNHGGGWVCLELKTGEKQWEERAVGKGSLCFADDMLYLFSENGGQAALANCSPESLELSGKVKVDGSGPSWAHPVVVGGRLYLRYDTHLYCLAVK